MQLQSSYALSTDLAFQQMEDLVIHSGFNVMTKNRYNEILHSLRGFQVKNRSAQDEEEKWIQHGNFFCQLWPLEKLMFQNSIVTLFNWNNCLLTYNNELISSRAGDVESKTVSDRKSCKEGPVADCISDSQTSVMFGMKLRGKGDVQVDNMQKLLDTLL